MQRQTQSGWQVGTLFKIPLKIDPSWLFIVGLITIANGAAWQVDYPDWAPGLAWGAGFAMALLLFGSVLMHELGHSLVAQFQGTRVNSITLFLFGGIAAIDGEAKTPGNAFWVAIAGPLVSFSLWGVLGLVSQGTAPGTLLHAISQDLAHLNLVLALFNLIPGLPLDGGQVLKAVVWKVTGSRFKGVRWAARFGQGLGGLAIALGVLVELLFGEIGGLWMALLGWFGLRNATRYHRLTDLQEGLLALQAKDAMTRDFRVVDAEQTIQTFAETYIAESDRVPVYFAASAGRYRGWVDVNDLNILERSEWGQRRVEDIAHKLLEIPFVREQTPLPVVIQRLEQERLPFITVLSPADTVAGIVDRGDIVRAVGNRLHLPIPTEEIERIKQEGTFPTAFQLPAIAKSVLMDLDPSPPTSLP